MNIFVADVYFIVLCVLAKSMVSLSLSVKPKPCMKLDPELFAPCVNIGHTHTFPLPPNIDLKKISAVLHEFRDEITANCSAPEILTDTVHCTMLLPLCVEGRELPLLPCRNVCINALHGCRNAVESYVLNEVGAMCNLLPDSNATSKTCFEPKGYNSGHNKADKNSYGTCNKLILPYCKDLGYNHTYLSNDTQAHNFHEVFNKTLEDIVNQTDLYERKFFNETRQEYPECAFILKKMICAEKVPPCYPGEVKRYYGLCSDECQQIHKLCPEFLESHPAGKELCSVMASGTAAHGFCGHSQWPKDQLYYWARKENSIASRQSNRPNAGVIAAAVIVPITILIMVIALVFVWRRYGIYWMLKKKDDMNPVMEE